MMELGSADLTVFALKRTSLGSVLDCVAPCLEESLLSFSKA